MEHFMGLLKLISLLSLFTLISCGGGQTTAQLEVSSSYISTSPFSGGFIVTGESLTGKKFTLAINGSNQGKILLDTDTWTFTAVAWDGGGTNKPFEGTPYCGLLSGFSLSSTNSTVKIDISNANCSTPDYLSATQFKNYFNVYGCDIFYQYASGTDSYSAVTDANIQTYCNSASMPNNYRTKFTNYRISALNTLGPLPKNIGFTSECKLINDNTQDLKLPMSKFPFIVSLYNSATDCSSNGPSQKYTFMNGFVTGGPGFDSILSQSQETLLLATSRTKRGKSPFMAEIPGLLCSASPSFQDCFADVTTGLSAHVKVPFSDNDGGWNEQVVLKNLSRSISSCPANVLSSSVYFNTDECSVDDGRMKIKPYKNAFMCQPSTGFFPGTYTIRDIHQKGDFIYVLRYDSSVPEDVLAIYTTKGKFIDEYSLGNYNLQKVAANLTGNKIAALHSTGVRTYTYTLSSGSLNFDNEWSAAGTQLEISTTGSFYYVAGANIVSSYATATGVNQDSLTFTGSINDLEFRSVYLHVLESSSGNVYKITSYTGELDNTVPAAYFTATGSTSNILVNGDKILYLDGVNYYIQDTVNATTSGPYNIGTFVSTPLGISATFNKVIIYDTAEINTFASGTSTPQLSLMTGNCTEAINISSGAVSKLVTFNSREDTGVETIFQDMFGIFGRRFLGNNDHPFYYFQALSDNGDELNTGGDLRRVQEMLSPQALGAFFSEYASCNDVKNAAPFSKNAIFKDDINGESMSFTVSVAPTTEAINAFNCVATEGGPCGGVQYDLVINFVENDDGETEKMKIKLKCGTQIGSFESYELESDQTPARVRRELLVYHTASDADSRFEKYTFENESRIRTEVSKLYKTDPNTILSRRVQVEVDGPKKSASIQQLERNSSNIMTSRFEIYSSTIAGFGTLSGALNGFPAINMTDVRDGYNMDNVNNMDQANICANTAETNIYGTDAGPCTFQAFSTNPLSKNSLYLRPLDFGIESTSHPLRISSGGVFEITP